MPKLFDEGTLILRPFPSSPGPLYQNEAKCSAFDIEMIFHSHAKKDIFSQERLCIWRQFESKGFWNSEVAYLSGYLTIFLPSQVCVKRTASLN